MKAKKILAVAMGVAFTLSTAACQKEEKNRLTDIKQAGVITMATSPDFGPYEFMDLTKDGQEAIVGCDVELGRYIAKEIGVDIEIEPMDFEACQAAVSQGKIDFSISGYAKTPERAESMECSDLFNWIDLGDKSSGILIRKDDADTLKDSNGFKGKTIAAQNGSLQLGYTEDQLPDAKIEVVSSCNDGVLMLLNGKVDGLATSYDTAEQFTKNYPELTMSEFVFTGTLEDGYVILAPKGETELMTEINKAMAKAQKEGLFDKWLQESIDLCNKLGIEVNE